MGKITVHTLSWDALGISQEDLERELAIYCDCNVPDEHPQYVDQATMPDGAVVNHHGWICRKCKKYVQVG